MPGGDALSSDLQLYGGTSILSREWRGDSTMARKKWPRNWALVGAWALALGLAARAQTGDSLITVAVPATEISVGNDLSATSPISSIEKLANQVLKSLAAQACPKGNESIIFHLAVWQSPSSLTSQSATALASSSWYVLDGSDGNAQKEPPNCTFNPAPLKPDGQPLLYGVSKATLIGVSVETPDGGLPSEISYQVSATPQQSQNLTDVASIFQALTGAATSREKTNQSSSLEARVAVAVLPAAAPRPYAINISYVVAPTASGAQSGAHSAQQATSPTTEGQASAPSDCSNVADGCTVTRTFVNEDKEWWGLSLAIPPLGYNAQTYSSATAPASIGRQSGLYGMLDLYPAAAWRPEESWVPHAVAGLPVAGKPLQKAYFGIGENLTGYHWLASRGFNFPVSVTYGFVHFKEDRILGGTVAPHWVWKDMFTLELPVSTLVSLVKPGK